MNELVCVEGRQMADITAVIAGGLQQGEIIRNGHYVIWNVRSSPHEIQPWEVLEHMTPKCKVRVIILH